MDVGCPAGDRAVDQFNKVYPKRCKDTPTTCNVRTKHDYECQLRVGNKPRFRDKPPADTEPDTSYRPSDDETFWFKCELDGWVFRDSSGQHPVYKGRSLPAVPR